MSLAWEEADAENLPYADESFDVVLSCVGVMFAPHHRAAADELVRVSRVGGRIGLLSWTPVGFIGQMFATMKPYAPPPPPGAQPPPLWGSQDHVTKLFGDRITDVTAQRKKVQIDHFDSAEAFRDYCVGNVLKYASRWRHKNGIEDLRKASVYLLWAISVVARRPQAAASYNFVEITGLYWHFVDLVWIMVFTFMYLL